MNAVKSMLVALQLLVMVSMATAQVPKLEPTWQRNHAPEGRSLETRAAAATADGGVAVLGVQRPLALGKDKSGDQGWVGVFTADGQLRQQLSFVMRPGDLAVKEVDAFVPLPTGEFVVAGQAASGDSWLVHVDAAGATRAIRPLGRSRIAFMLPLADGGLVVGGRAGRDLYAARLRANGELVWERQLDRGFDDLFLAGAVAADGVVMLEHSGVREQFFMRDAVVALSLLREGDESIKAPSFSVPGRAGALAAVGGAYGLLVDTGVGVKQNLKFLRLSGEFKPVSQTEVLDVQFSLERARLAQAGPAGFLVLALDGNKLVGMHLNPAGQLKARFESPAGRVFLHPDATASGDATFAVASELLERDDKRGARSTVYVARLPVRAD